MRRQGRGRQTSNGGREATTDRLERGSVVQLHHHFLVAVRDAHLKVGVDRDVVETARHVLRHAADARLQLEAVVDRAHEHARQVVRVAETKRDAHPRVRVTCAHHGADLTHSAARHTRRIVEHHVRAVAVLWRATSWTVRSNSTIFNQIEIAVDSPFAWLAFRREQVVELPQVVRAKKLVAILVDIIFSERCEIHIDTSIVGN